MRKHRGHRGKQGKEQGFTERYDSKDKVAHDARLKAMGEKGVKNNSLLDNSNSS